MYIEACKQTISWHYFDDELFLKIFCIRELEWIHARKQIYFWDIFHSFSQYNQSLHHDVFSHYSYRIKFTVKLTIIYCIFPEQEFVETTYLETPNMLDDLNIKSINSSGKKTICWRFEAKYLV